MPQLDRKIVILYTAPGTRDQYGEYVEGVERRFDVWAQLRSQEGTDYPEVAGQRRAGRKTYRVRWFSVIADIQSVYLTVLDGTLSGEGSILRYNVENFREVTGSFAMRRRFFDLDVFSEI